MKQHKLIYASSYDRGLEHLLFLWSDIKKAVPNAELHIAYGWQTFDALVGNNPERRQWKWTMEKLMSQEGITHHGRLSKKDLDELTKNCGIWAYPTDFEEINCITALNCQKFGCVPVVTNFAALKETVWSGTRIKESIETDDGRAKYLESLIEMMTDTKLWKRESKKAKLGAHNYLWEKIADQWIDIFNTPLTTPLVSVITPTIRTGWWNIIANNLSNQTYKNFEWIIVDDYKEDRSKIAEKYANQYNLNIKYVRGDKAVGKYDKPCGLVRANNIGWKNSKGELCVWLQDFIVMPNDGLEKLVDMYRHNPDTIVAPVDEYYNAVEPDKENDEDWWNGETKIMTNKSWTNPRVENKGIRESHNPYDYEANYGAIPKHILEELNGFWEFMDDGLGYDNTEIAMRAIEAGYRLVIDDTNIARCINIWPVVGGTGENVLNRERMSNPPRYVWLLGQTKKQKLPLVRDESMDQKIRLQYEIPKELPDDKVSEWVKSNTKSIISKWKDNG